MFRKIAPLASGVALALGAMSSAHAGAIYSYHNPAPTSVNTAGVIDSLSFVYDTDERLSFGSSISANNGLLPDAGWFVLSPGPQPRGNATELAIFYMDFTSRDVYAYAYNGINGFTSYENSAAHIATYTDVLSFSDQSAGGFNISFNGLDISAVQNFMGGDWTGAAFGDQIGVWSHFTVLDNFSAAGGIITDFDAGLQSFFDTIDPGTTQVPEPAGLAFFGLLGIVGSIALRRRKAK